MKIKFKNIFILPLCVAVFFFSERRPYLVIALSAALLHELGHIIAARFLGIKLKTMSLDIFGARLDTSSPVCSYGAEIILCFAGPAANLLSAGFALSIPFIYLYKDFFITASLFFSFLNLLPVNGFDGGRILRCVIASFGAPDAAERVLSVLSFGVCTSLWSISVYLLLRTGMSLSLFVFSASLFCRIFISE